jgi:hypothetical protein
MVLCEALTRSNISIRDGKRPVAHAKEHTNAERSSRLCHCFGTSTPLLAVPRLGRLNIQAPCFGEVPDITRAVVQGSLSSPLKLGFRAPNLSNTEADIACPSPNFTCWYLALRGVLEAGQYFADSMTSSSSYQESAPVGKDSLDASIDALTKIVSTEGRLDASGC